MLTGTLFLTSSGFLLIDASIVEWQHRHILAAAGYAVLAPDIWRIPDRRIEKRLAMPRGLAN